jgi:hypothetical protein
MTFKDWFTQEHDRELGKRIKDATRFSMTPTERDETRARLLEYARMRPVRVTAPARKRRQWFAAGFHPLPVIALLLILVVGTGSAGAASLAQHALPGDLLYPIKVNVNEEVKVALAKTPAEKADVALARAETRIEEIRALEERGGVDEKLRSEVDARLDAQVRAAEIGTLEAEDDAYEMDHEARLIALLHQHESLLASIEIGGAAEPEAMMATFAAPEVATSTTTVVADIDTPRPMAFMAPATEQQTVTDAPTAARMKARTEDTESDAAQESPINKDGVARQMRAAHQRVASLETLLERMEGRVDAEALAQANTDLISAEEALGEGEDFFEDESFADASVRFNAAMRIAINAREFLADAPRTQETSTHSNSKANDDETGEKNDSRGPSKNDYDVVNKKNENNDDIHEKEDTAPTPSTSDANAHDNEDEHNARDDHDKNEGSRDDKPSLIKSLFKIGL